MIYPNLLDRSVPLTSNNIKIHAHIQVEQFNENLSAITRPHVVPDFLSSMEHKGEFLKNIQAILVNEDWACQALKRHKRHKKSSK